MTDREKGVASTACPGCGNELALSDQPDGSVAAETCASCHPADAPKPETASVARTPRERGTNLQSNEEE